MERYPPRPLAPGADEPSTWAIYVARADTIGSGVFFVPRDALKWVTTSAVGSRRFSIVEHYLQRTRVDFTPNG